MASHGSSGLKELLSSSPNQTPYPFSRLILSSTSPLGVDLALKIKELSVQESSPSPPKSGASSSPPLLFVIPLSPQADDQRAEKKLGKEKQEGDADEKEQSTADGRSSSASGKCFPPPISSLKRIKTGKAYRFVRFDEETQSYVAEGIKISQ